MKKVVCLLVLGVVCVCAVALFPSNGITYADIGDYTVSTTVNTVEINSNNSSDYLSGNWTIPNGSNAGRAYGNNKAVTVGVHFANVVPSGAVISSLQFVYRVNSSLSGSVVVKVGNTTVQTVDTGSDFVTNTVDLTDYINTAHTDLSSALTLTTDCGGVCYTRLLWCYFELTYDVIDYLSYIDDLSAEILSLQGRISTLEGQLYSANAEVELLEGQVESLQANLTLLQGQYNAVVVQLGDMPSQLEELESALIACEGQLALANAEILRLQSLSTGFDYNTLFFGVFEQPVEQLSSLFDDKNLLGVDLKTLCGLVLTAVFGFVAYKLIY